MIRKEQIRFIAVVLLLQALTLSVFKTSLGTMSNEKIASEKEIRLLKAKLACENMGILENGGFCLDKKKPLTGWNQDWDGKLCAGLEEVFGYSSVADFGAGLGHYGTCFLRYGGSFIKTTNLKEATILEKRYRKEMEEGDLVDKPQVIKSWVGYDGALNIEELSEGRILHADLSVPFDLGRKFDWVLSLEVGEHIPREKEDVFINNLLIHACKGIALSWAVEGQHGHFHINNRNNNYIVAKMRNLGLVEDEETTKKLREMAYMKHFKRTTMIFKFPEARC